MIRLQLFGNLSLQNGGVPVRPVLTRPKRFGLLAYLSASDPGVFHRRDTLLGIFWPELDEEHARSALRQSLYGLRRTLGTDVIRSRGKDLLGVDERRLWCDAATFRALLSEGKDEDALALYRGPLLRGFHLPGSPEFDRWMEEERHRHQIAALAAAGRRADEAQAQGAASAARRWAEQAVALGPYDEEACRRYLHLLVAQGNGAAALGVYDDFARRLEIDLGLSPSPETVALAEGIRSARVRAPEPESQSSPPASGSAGGVGRPAPTDGDRLATGPSPIPKPVGVDASSGSRVLRTRFGQLALTLVLTVAIGSYAVYSQVGGAAAERPIRSIVVLPFENLSRDSAEDYFSEGMTEALISELGKVGSLDVISRTTAMRLRNTGEPVPALARRLGVDGVIEGAVLRADGRVRLTVRLIRGATDREMWSESYEDELRGVIDLQKRTARAIVGALGPALSVHESSIVETARPIDPDAYAAYLRGRYQFTRWTAESMGAATNSYRDAIRLDPEYAPAHAGLAYALLHECYFGLPNAPPAASCQREVEAAALRALTLDSTSSDAQLTLGLVRWWGHNRDRHASERALREAIRLNPGNAEAHARYGFLLTTLERHDEGISHFERAYALDPLSPERAAFVGWAYGAATRFAEAERHVRRAIELEPAFPSGYAWLAHWILVPQGRFEEAIGYAQKALELSGGNQLFRSYLGHALARAGRTEEAEAVLEQLTREISAAGGPPFQIAIVMAGLGRREEALELLERTLAEGWGHVIYLKVNPAWEPLRGHPRFAALVREVGLRE